MYAICFGGNAPPAFTRVPGNSEVDSPPRYLPPNRFCGEIELRRKLIPPRRFRKLDIETEVSMPEITWAILYILLRVRRGTPDLYANLADGTPTSRLGRDIWPLTQLRNMRPAWP